MASHCSSRWKRDDMRPFSAQREQQGYETKDRNGTPGFLLVGALFVCVLIAARSAFQTRTCILVPPHIRLSEFSKLGESW